MSRSKTLPSLSPTRTAHRFNSVLRMKFVHCIEAVAQTAFRHINFHDKRKVAGRSPGVRYAFVAGHVWHLNWHEDQENNRAKFRNITARNE